MKNFLSFSKVKLILIFISSLLIVLSAILLISTIDGSISSNKMTYAAEYDNEDLEFRLINGGTAYEVSRAIENKAEIIIPSTYNGKPVIGINPYVFSHFISLVNITIPNSVTSIGDYAFNNCISLTNITIGNGVKSIGYYTFAGCSSLTNITIPNSITNIGGWAFLKCSLLTNITIPDSVISIGGYAFSDCSKLTNITIPNSVTSIEGSVFSGCSSLKNITIPDSITNIEGYAFAYCSSLINITIPDNITSIGYAAFAYCSSLANITIGNSEISIGGFAFSRCSALTNITIPDKIISIGNGAFSHCSSLTTLNVCRKSSQNITLAGEDLLYNMNSNLKIYVPADSLGIYRGAACWNEYADKIVAAETTLPTISGATEGGKYLGAEIKIADASGIKLIILNQKKIENNYRSYEVNFIVNESGNYELIAEDIWGNQKKINFAIDICDRLYYQDVDSKYNLFDKEKLESGEKIWLSAMSFKLESYTDCTFKVDDKIQAAINSGGSAFLNIPVALGKHTLTIISRLGTIFSFEFYINPNNPVIKGISDNGRYESGSNNLISFTDDGDKYYDTSGSSIKSVKLFNNNSVEFKLIDTFGKEAGYPFSSDYLLPATAGKYTLTVTNMADNVTQISFTITISIPPEEPINASANLTLTGTSKNGVTKGSAAIVWNINSSVTVNATIDDIKFNYKNGDILTVSGRYIIVVDDGICKETFEFILDNDVSYTCNIGNGAITNENVIINCVESLTIVLTKNYQKINYEFGQEITEDGNYTAIIKDALGNSIEFNFTIIKKAKTGFSFTCPDDHEIARYVKNGVEQSLPANTLFLNFDSDGTYVITVRNKLTQETYTYTLTIDTIPPELNLTNIKNGVAANSVKMQSVSKQNVTIIVKKDGIAIDAGLGTVLRENGVYTIEVTDEIGNVNTYNFTIDKHPDWVVMVISLAAGIALVAVFGVLGHLRRKKSYKSA